MNRRTWPIVSAVTAVLLGALMIYLYLKATPYSAEIDHGPAPEAQANPYLAAEHFLRKQGLSVSHANSLDILPSLAPKHHSLLLLGDRYNMTPRQIDQVLNWTRAGGRLLFVAQSLWDEKTGQSNDLLLDRVQLQQSLSKDLKDPPPDTPGDPYPQLTKLYLENEDAPAYAGFDTAFHLEDPKNLAQTWANSGKATHMMQLNHGLGSIIVVTDADLWKTPAIDQYDNAWLLWYLTVDTGVTLLFNTEHDNLLTLLLRHFPQALVALLALIGLGCWHFGVRHGPLLEPQAKARRQLQEHLRASADFMLRHNGQDSLLQALQQDILRRVRHRHPGYEQLDVAEQWRVLARLSGQPTERYQPSHGPAAEAATFQRRIQPPGRPSANFEECVMSQPIEPDAINHATQQRQRACQLAQAVRHELQKAVIGQNTVIDDVLTALLAGGHVLLEGVPGLGKTLLVRALARCFGGEFARIQFTPDLMPSDVTGHAVYDLQTEQFKLRKGPLFTNLLLADEINRAPAKTQAALLEAMQERQVTLEGRALPIAAAVHGARHAKPHRTGRHLPVAGSRTRSLHAQGAHGLPRRRAGVGHGASGQPLDPGRHARCATAAHRAASQGRAGLAAHRQ